MVPNPPLPDPNPFTHSVYVCGDRCLETPLRGRGEPKQGHEKEKQPDKEYAKDVEGPICMTVRQDSQALALGACTYPPGEGQRGICVAPTLSEGDSSELLESGTLDDTVAFMCRWLGFHGVHDARIKYVRQSASQSDHQLSNDKLEVIVAGWVARGKRHISQARRNATETVCHPPPLPCVHNDFIAISTKVRIASGGVVGVEVPDTVSPPSFILGGVRHA